MSSSCWDTENLYIKSYYSALLNKYGVNHRALDWGSQATQELRFAVLTEMGSLEGCSVLDVGCGLADLLDFLLKRGLNVSYTGYDLTPAMISSAKLRFPQVSLEVRDLRTESNLLPRFDYVLASGIFYLRQTQASDYLEEMVRKMFTLCRKGIAFNTLSTQAREQQPGEFYADPAAVLAMCLRLTPRVVLRHDYLPHDFTVYLYKD